jgi:hypothetical protein
VPPARDKHRPAGELRWRRSQLCNAADFVEQAARPLFVAPPIDGHSGLLGVMAILRLADRFPRVGIRRL